MGDKKEERFIEPISNRIIAELVELAPSEAGIILPGVTKDKQNAAKVLYVGPGVVQVKPGDVVLYHHYVNFPFFGKDLTTFHENEVIGIIRTS